MHVYIVLFSIKKKEELIKLLSILNARLTNLRTFFFFFLMFNSNNNKVVEIMNEI